MRDFGTPMMKQYMAIKSQYEDCLLFFRLGDFYELFLDDALIGARILNIVLTKRPRGKDGDIPMAGVPFHAADSYIAKLVKAGYKIAICEQVSEPNNKGIVEREVVRIVTPGTILDEKTLDAKKHNYTISFSYDKDVIGIAVADISTGDFQVTEIKVDDMLAQQLANELARFNPSECILNTTAYNTSTFLKMLTWKKDMNIYAFPAWNEHAEDAQRLLKKHFNVRTLKGFGLDGKHQAEKAAAALLGYLSHTQKDKVGHMTTLKTYSPHEYVILDSSTVANLELFTTLRDGDEKGSFIGFIDETKTAIGGRQLSRWVQEPLKSKKEIEQRLDAVELFIQERKIRSDIRLEMGLMYDLERIVSRLSVGIGTPHDLINLKETIKKSLHIYKTLDGLHSSYIKNPYIKNLRASIPLASPLAEYIEKHLLPHPALDPKEGGLIPDGIDTELDKVRNDIKGSQEWILGLEQRERERTGIGSLKVRFNSVFGYYIEISRSNIHLVPKEYLRKQTTVHAERFITPELGIYEEKVLRGQDIIHKLEYKIFLKIIARVMDDIELIQKAAHSIADLDCLLGLAELSERERYTRPVMTTDGSIKIHDGRHPVVECIQKDSQEHSFVPNDTLLNCNDNQLLIITGPNMAGKSVYMRQVAMIVLMSHIGSFVPARHAQIALVDRIFVRSGAADSIGKGLSTFMVEMVETAYILHHATPASLIIMDEIGRGTSTYDGISIAWAIAEYVVTHPEHAAKTLFATHYHELQQLESEYPDHIRNYHMAIEETKNGPLFLYRLARGGAVGSYGIAVAKLAGIPPEVANRAEELLHVFADKKDAHEHKIKNTLIEQQNKPEIGDSKKVKVSIKK